MRRTKEDAEQTRKNLLQAAERVFGTKGYAATRLSDIAKEANVTRGAIYHHFGNKKELFISLGKERVNPYFEMLDGIFESDLSPKGKIEKMFREVIQGVLKDVDFLIKQRFEFLRDFESIDCDDMHEFFEKKANLHRASLVSLFKQGQQTGDIRQDISPEVVAFTIETYLRGLLTILVIDKKNAFIRNHIDELIKTVLIGL